ncbi:MAG: hypothetical protein R3C11_16790 [Planctomycetaceae bacterium]
MDGDLVGISRFVHMGAFLSAEEKRVTVQVVAWKSLVASPHSRAGERV